MQGIRPAYVGQHRTAMQRLPGPTQRRAFAA